MKILSEDQIVRIHEASMKLLQDFGIRVEHDEALRFLHEHGATVDFQTKVVKLPESLVLECVKRAPKTIRLSGRDVGNDFILEDQKAFFGPGSGTTYVVDLETGQRRRSTKQDIKNAAKIADGLSNIDFVTAAGTSLDYPECIISLHEVDAALSNTMKHVHIYSWGDNATLIRDKIRIAQLVAGGEKELRNRPLISCLTNQTSAMVFDQPATESLVEFAKAGIPLVWDPAQITGVTSPITLAGRVAQGNAEALAGNTVMQIINPGTPYVFAAGGFCDLDMVTGNFTIAAVESMISYVASAQLGKYYGIPTLGYVATDSKVPDAQAGSEACMYLTISVLAGTSYIKGLGYLESVNSNSNELMVIMDDIIGMFRRMHRGIDTSDEALSVELIEKIGHAGSFLGSKHTRDHFASEHYLPKLMDRNSFTEWTKRGSKRLEHVANERARQLLREHFVEPLPEDLVKEIKNIIDEAEKRELKKSPLS